MFMDRVCIFCSRRTRSVPESFKEPLWKKKITVIIEDEVLITSSNTEHDPRLNVVPVSYNAVG